MGHVREKFHVDAPIEVCWELGADPGRFLEWQEGVLDVTDYTGKLDHLGAGYSPVFRIAGRRLEGRFEVTRIDKPRVMELTGTNPAGARSKSTTSLEPAGTGTDVIFELEYELPGGFVGQFADKLFMERSIERQIRHSNENFKAICEAKVPAHV